MKDPMRYVERFCYEHPRFGIPNLMRYIALGNVVLWVLGLVNSTLLSYLSFSAYDILHGQVWRLVTFFLIPPSRSILAFLLIFFYYWAGSTLEQYWGTGPFTFFVLSGIVLTALFGFAVYFITGLSYQLTAYYVYMALFFAFAAYFPDTQVMFYGIIPLKVKYLAYLDAVFFVWAILTDPFPMNLLPLVAGLNFLLFCGGELFRHMPGKVSKNTVNFRRESRRIRREQAAKLYNHKCAVCGRTDLDYPELEFRYCSRCQGYHCFCQDHINSHIHFTE